MQQWQQQWAEFLHQQGFQIHQDEGIIGNHTPSNPTNDGTYFTPLPNYDTLVLTGPDNTQFLQGQISCNLDHLSASKSLRGAYCTPKGNVISNFDLCLHDDTVYLHMAKGMAAIVKAAMAKYIVFSKAKLHDQSHDWVRFGVWGAHAASTVQGLAFINGFMYDASSNNTSPRYVIYCPPEQAQAVWQALSKRCQPVKTCAWEAVHIQAGMAYISPAISDSYVPQMLNLQETNAIDFKKGCYTGQEIVARMQYLGRLKRHLMIGKISIKQPQEQPLVVGMPIDASERNNIGRIVSLANMGEGHYWFSGVINIKEAQDKDLHISGIKGSRISLIPLPYEIDPQVFERIKL